MANKNDYLGAVASNAGDHFHVMWATREILRLLDAGNDVAAVKIEGVPASELHDELGDHAQAVDVTLTKRAADGPRYRYLQLKYSASNPEAKWTWSRLLQRRTKTKPNSSVLGKLAGVVKATNFQGDFAIVTNQPLAVDVASDVALLIMPDGIHAAENAKLVKKLTKELGLKTDELAKFCQLWDLTEFSAATRQAIEAEVNEQLIRLTDAEARDVADDLLKRVAALMLPESVNDAPVTLEKLLVWLGAGSRVTLFPAPSHIEAASPYLRRSVVDRLVETLRAAGGKPIRVHAAGGCGKTSLLCGLRSELPAYSEVFIYDCYGGGLFLASDQRRHMPEHAFSQLSNEMAARLLMPLVMRRHGSIDVLAAFRARVSVAAGILAARSPDAQLVLCFDAVDNARIGADHWREPCFLDLLSQASGWPANVRIVVSCRTARLAEVGEKRLYEDFEVPSFDTSEVDQLITLLQPKWSTEFATEFESLTGGNPRRLVYAIKGLPSDSIQQAIDRLMPKGDGINPLFEKRVAEAGKHLRHESKVWQVLDALAHLPRPIPTNVLSTVADLVPADIGDIAVDVGGIIEREGGWSFHDEDFEAFVIERPGSGGRALLERAADQLLQARLTDRYAALSIAEVLANAGRLEELYALVTNSQEKSSVLSELEMQFVWSRRLSFAIRCCRNASDATNACLLLIEAADATRRVKLLEELVVDNLDLSVRFAADEANRLALVSQDYRSKRPSLRIEHALLNAKSRPETAKFHYRWWRAYLGELGKPNPAFRVQPRDIAAEFLTCLALFGEEKAIANLLLWRPKSFLTATMVEVAQAAAGQNRQLILNTIGARRWPPVALAPLMTAAILAGAQPNDPVMHASFERLARATSARWGKVDGIARAESSPLDMHDATLFLCERAVAYDELKPLVVDVLDHAFPKPDLSEAHLLYRLLSSGGQYARAHALRELIAGVTVPVKEWLPPRRPEPNRSQTDRSIGYGGRREKSPEERWNETLEETTSEFSVFVEAARVTLMSLASEPSGAWSELERILDNQRGVARKSIRHPQVATQLMRNHVVHTALSTGSVSSLTTRMRKTLLSLQGDSISRALNLAKALVLMPQTHDAARALLTDIGEQIKSDALGASQRVKLLSESARIAAPVDSELARWLFNSAVESAGTVDIDARGALVAAGTIGRAGLAASEVEAAALAARLADAARSLAASLEVDDDFHWDEVIEWMSHISIPAALVAAARWQDEGLVPFDDSLQKVIAMHLALSLASRTALATLTTDGPVDLQALVTEGELLPDWLVTPALEDQFRHGEINSLLTAFDTLQKIAAPDASSSIAAAKSRCDTVRAWNGIAEKVHSSTDKPGDELDADEVVRIHTEAGIRAALTTEGGNGRLGAHHFIDVAERLDSMALRVPFLEISAALGANDGEFGEAVPQILRLWSKYPPVDTWLREQFPAYISRSLYRLFQWSYEDTEVVEAALAATGLPAAAQVEVLLTGIEQLGNQSSASVLYALAGLVASRSPIERRAQLLEALLSLVESRASRAPSVRLTDVAPPLEVAECVARTVFSAFGDADRRMRWRASHAALVLLRAKDPAWEKLVACLARDNEPIFANAPFYRYAALEQLMSVLLRAAAEAPVEVAKYTQLVLDAVFREKHVIVRELGRAVLLTIHQSGAWRAAGGEVSRVLQINRCILPPSTRYSNPKTEVKSENERIRKYAFDDMDAIPYWYAPAAEFFDLRMPEFLDRLETWIHGKWGFGEDTTYWANEPRPRRFRTSDAWSSRRHGERSAFERLSHHIEWHAMMCAVGELIDEQPACEADCDSELAEWIRSYLPTVAPQWLSDLRSSSPLEPRFWGIPPEGVPRSSDRPQDEYETAVGVWGRSVSEDAFDAEITASEDLVVAASFETRWNEAVQRVSIDSALVSPRTAIALARALANTHDHMDFALPDGHFHRDIQEQGFKLETWLISSPREPMEDRFDERRGVVAGIPVSPSRARKWRPELSGPSGADSLATEGRAIKIAQWGTEESRNGHGWRATAAISEVTEILDREKRSLILLVEVTRYLRGDETERFPTRWVLYVLRADGTLTRVDRERRSLGRFLVRRERLHNSVDTLGRWMLHRAAELCHQRDAAGARKRASLDRAVEKLCAAFRTRNRTRH